MHWWYRPDSYDEFVSASVAPLELDDDKPNTRGAGACGAPPMLRLHFASVGGSQLGISVQQRGCRAVEAVCALAGGLRQVQRVDERGRL